MFQHLHLALQNEGRLHMPNECPHGPILLKYSGPNVPQLRYFLLVEQEQFLEKTHNMMFYMNRAVVLKCPELNVPFFTLSYFKKQIMPRKYFIFIFY